MTVSAPRPDQTASARDFTAPSVDEALQAPLFEGWTGHLRVYPQRLRIHLHQGFLSAVEGHQPLGQLLVQRGHLSETQLAQALTSRTPLGQTLLQGGLVSAQHLQDALAVQAQQALDELRRHPPTFYSFRFQSAPVPTGLVHAGLTLGDLGDPQDRGDLTDAAAILRLAPHDQPVHLSAAAWKLLRWFNGRRSLARVIELSALPPGEARDAVCELRGRGLLEPSAIAGLPVIMARLKPATEHRQPPASIRANLFLKHLNGESSMQHIIERLNYPLEEAALMLTGLYRDGVLELLRGQHEMQRLLEEY